MRQIMLSHLKKEPYKDQSNLKFIETGT
jgi:hypothetical protein